MEIISKGYLESLSCRESAKIRIILNDAFRKTFLWIIKTVCSNSLGWGFVSGWGPSADKLKQAKLPLRSNEDCKKKYQILFDRQVHLCAGEGRIGVSGGCRGDSGGPFVCEKGDTWYLHGAVSFGMSRCTTEYYTVFTRITNYVHWILRKIGI